MTSEKENALVQEAENLCEKASQIYLGSPREAIELLKKAESLLTSSGAKSESDEKKLCHCLNLQSVVYQRLSEFESANQSAMRACALAKKCDDDKLLALSIRSLGNVAFYKSAFNDALDLYKSALPIAERTGEKKTMAGLLVNIGNIYHHLGEYALSMVNYKNGLEKFKEIGNKRGEANAYINIGNSHYALGDYAAAIEHHLNGLKRYEEIGDEQGQSMAHSGLGLVYERLGSYQKAIEHYRNSLDYEERVGDRRSYALTLNNLGNVYASMGDYKTASDYYQRSLDIKRQILDRQGIAHTLINLADMYFAQGLYRESHKASAESLETIELVGDKSSEALCLITLAKVLSEPKAEAFDIEKAIECLNKAITIATDISAKGALSEAYQSLSNLYERQGDASLALRYFKKYHEIEQELKSEESAKRIQNLSVAFEAEQAKKESELRRLEAEKYRLQNVELVKANQFKTELLAIAAHDLKNPLQSIMGFAQLIKEQKNDVDAMLASAAVIQRSSEKMLSLINSLLDDAKAEMMTFDLKPSAVNFSELVKQSVETQFKAQAAQKSQTILLDANEELIVKGDAERLKQVVDNLISNAIKYSPRGKTIQVRVHRGENNRNGSNNETAVFAVKDEGQGLTEDDKAKLFEKFQRLSAKPTAGESSTGLGLAIVKQLVELHCGKIWAESDGKNKGATFFVELPLN